MIDLSLYPSDRTLDDLIGSYDVRELDGLADHSAHLWHRITSYQTAGDKPYGEAQLAPHLQRISQDLHDFLKHLGYSEIVANNAREAYLYSDIGKTDAVYNDIDWLLDDRPSEEEKELRREHTWRGVDIWRNHFKDLPLHNMHPHVTLVTPALMIFHHEKIDGTGQFKRDSSQLGNVMQAACLVDAFDGDMIPRAHQTAQRTVSETLERLTGVNESKYFGAFDENLLKQYKTYRQALAE